MSGWIFLAGTIAVTVAAQLAFKQYFRGHRRRFIIAAIALFCLAVPCTYLAVRELGIGRVYVGAALTYVLTPLAARRFFGEHLATSHFAGLGLIVAGVIVYNL
ncbi:MAG TPA: SMR family transporter [Rhodanobacteraceae bacterium]|nr:SMR family transporter [Rhodanobacteraceae bacterium]